ncbi:eukaryotic translation initiation factor eIF2A-domain-containing protein [Glomus cerebriforme]|uniref:Eukaryotic translation initiation factor 2A n=1 Tax=Glomus cerebriforme TaxID=658196 RepID=A0A397SWM2_9GLOM|nr:eukaryotic translation initiation factor eIF2A-domain-containing protein [Glomus cerebriforme]
MTDAPPTQFAYRSASSLGLVFGHPTYEPVANFQDPGSNVKTFQYSKDGKYLGWAFPESVKIIDAETVQLVSEIPKKQIVEIGFSPKGTYISTWERPVKLPDGSVHKNLIIWEVKTGEELISFTQKSQNNWNVQWTEDEMFFGRMVTGEVHFYDSKRLDKGIYSKLRLENIGDFSLSPGKSPSIAVFIPEKNAAPAIVRIYSIPHFNAPLAQKTFFKADKIQMKWNDLGTNLLVLAQTDVDKTNKSYYGETNLYFLSVAGNYDCRVFLDKEGPIHDVTWGPNSKEFVVIYGYMPAKVTLFDHRANPVHEFGTNFRNTVKFNPQGRLIFIAGFGNLNGTMDIWDRKTLKKITAIEAPNSSESSWSPDGRYIMTAILSPRLRVDNGYKIWHYTGSLVHSQNIQELLQVQWRPASVEFYPMRQSLSPVPVIAESPTSPTKTAPIKAGAYLPPHARARGAPTVDIFKREEVTDRKVQENGAKPVGASETTSKIAARNKKKRESKKKKEEAAANQPSKEVDNSEDKDTPIVSPSSTSSVKNVIINNGMVNSTNNSVDAIKSDPTADTTQQSASHLSETEKKIRNLTKKLRQIAELKERQKNGDKLEITQVLPRSIFPIMQRVL